MTFEQWLKGVREQVINVPEGSATSRGNIMCKGTEVGAYLPAQELLGGQLMRGVGRKRLVGDEMRYKMQLGLLELPGHCKAYNFYIEQDGRHWGVLSSGVT